MLATDNTKIEMAFTQALDALTRDMLTPAKSYGQVDTRETYQLLCLRELVRGMVAARLLAESATGSMQKEDVHALSSRMLDSISLLYPALGLSNNVGEAVEELSKMSSVSAWKIHTRILNLLNPSKRERPFPIPFWPAQFKAA